MQVGAQAQETFNASLYLPADFRKGGPYIHVRPLYRTWRRQFPVDIKWRAIPLWLWINRGTLADIDDEIDSDIIRTGKVKP